MAVPASAEVRISEFLASNLRGIADEDNNHEDWIEVYNDGTNFVSLEGWFLTDQASDLTKWRFPATNIGPQQFLLVFASDKNRRTPGRPLHTNFKLDSDGEFLALVKADGATIATQFSPAYPPQATDVSYGFAPESIQTVLAQGAAVEWKAWTNGTQFTNESPGWNSNLAYPTSGWTRGTSGLGWDDTTTPSVDFTPYFGTTSNPRSLVFGTSRALFARFKPQITSLAGARELRLRMKFDDGFAAWLNGSLVASNLAPADLGWSSLAAGNRTDALNDAWAQFSIPVNAAAGGTNLLALQCFNRTADSTDLLLLPELDLVYATTASTASYLLNSTPGQTNGAATGTVPPVIDLLSIPNRPSGGAASSALTVTARVTRTLWPITNVTLFYRTMFNAEIAVAMTPATGGVCIASIPTSGLNPGEMLRWRIEAHDASNNIGTGPRFTNANDDDRYFGTVALNPAAETNSRLPMVHWFPENFSAAITEGGARCSLFYLDRFYDNILFNLHGQTTSGFPKKGQDVDFNSNNRFRWRKGERDAKDVKLLTNWADKSKVRNTLAYEMFSRSGVSSHWAFPVRVQTNGTFYGIFDLVEDGDDRFLERVALDPNGALYKIYRSSYNDSAGYAKVSTNIWDYEKKSRKWEGVDDLAAFSAGVATNWSFAQRRSYVYDNVNIPAALNYFAALVITSCQDQGHKNFYLYRDSDGTREWHVLPWDVDLTFGHDYTGAKGYYDDEIRTNQTLQLGVPNRLKEIIFYSPELNQAFLRRLRTVMTTVLQPLGTPAGQSTNENRILELLDTMDPPGVGTSDADLDWQKWGSWVSGGGASTNPTNMMRPQAQRILDSFLPGRRLFLADSSVLSSGAPIPSTQPASVAVAVEVGDFNPTSGRQDQEYLLLRNTNAFAVDITGWELSGGVEYAFPPGTVIPGGGGASGNIGLLYVTANPYAFRQRTSGPGSNQFCLVSGPYSGQLSARGEALVLKNASGSLVASNFYVGAPSLAQQFLRITEIMYNPAPPIDSSLEAQEFEFLELHNLSPGVTLDLNGVSFANGVFFKFTNTTLLGPGQRLVLARNPAAFTARYGGGFNLAGPYSGYLENAGERLTLLDANHEEVLDFSFNNSWYPLTDGLGFSLVVVDELAEPDAWDNKSNWRSSGRLNGSPSAADPAPPQIAPIRVNEVLAHTDLPLVDSLELFNPTTNAVNIGGWFLTDDFFTPKKFRIPPNTVVPAGGFVMFRADSSFGLGPNGFLFSEYGDQAWLFAADTATNLMGYYHGFDFPDSPNGVSFGRHATSAGTEHFVLQSWNTLGDTNAGPRVGPVVISRFMYRPPDLPGGVDNDTEEFIELQNVTATNVALVCTFTNEPGYGAAARTNTWRLRNAVDFNFPTNLVLEAGNRLFVVGFDPSTNAAQLASFRSLYHIPTNVTILGPWQGKLDNSGESIELKAPDRPDVSATNLYVPYIMIEKVTYQHSAPWNAAADGHGAALQRIAPSAYANDPANWTAFSPSGAGIPDTDGDGMPDWWEVATGLNHVTNDASLDPDQDGRSNAQEYVARTDPLDPASILKLSVTPGDLGKFSFEAVATISYTVQSSDSLAPADWGPWSQILPTTTNRFIVFSNTEPSRTRFYRVVTPAVP